MLVLCRRRPTEPPDAMAVELHLASVLQEKRSEKQSWRLSFEKKRGTSMMHQFQQQVL